MKSDDTYNGAMEGFADRLRKLRTDRRKVISMRTVSCLCGLPPDAIRRYERGEAAPSIDALCRIADYYKVSLDYLVGRTEFK